MAQQRAAKRPPSPPHWTETLPNWIWLLVIASWVLVLYGRVLQAPFVYDDLDQIVRNPNLASWHNVFTRFLAAPVTFSSEFRSAASTGSSYRPLYWLSLALDRHLWGLHPAGFHLTNLFLHALNGALLLHLLRRLRIPSLAAIATTLLWLSLPINSEAVAWISARAYPLCLFFLLLSLIATGILILPFSALVILLYSRDKLSSLKQPSALIPLGADLGAIAMLFVIRLILGVHSATGASALWSFAPSLWKYLAWTILPLRMSVERSTSTPPNVASLPAILAIAGLLAFIAAIVVLWKRTPTAAAGLAWFLFAVAPFCGLIFLYQGMAERFLYIASVGMTLALISLAANARPPAKAVALSLVALWSVWGIFRLETRLSDWSSPISLYRSSLEATPSSAPLYFNLGFNLREEGSFTEAVDAYQNAIRINPDYQRAYSSLGETYARMGRLYDARLAYQQALNLNPDDAGTTLNLAVLLHQTGKDLEAEPAFRRAIDLAPNDAAAYTDLGVLLYQQGHTDEAAKMFQNAIDRRSTDPTPYFNLAILYQQSGRPDRALALYRKVLELHPNDPEALANIQRLQGSH
jgi:Flp pilus assembly protein TadD